MGDRVIIPATPYEWDGADLVLLTPFVWDGTTEHALGGVVGIASDAVVDVDEPVAGGTAAKPPPATYSLTHDIQFTSAMLDGDTAANTTGYVLNRMHNTAAQNAEIGPADAGSKVSQKPNIRDNITIVSDTSAEGGEALAFRGGWGTYPVLTSGDNAYDSNPSGEVTGPTNARCYIYQWDGSAKSGWTYPIQFRARLRLPYASLASPYKCALMWWSYPDTRWLVELDWFETFGTDRMRWEIAHHVDANLDGSATEQKLWGGYYDMTQWHIMDVLIDDDITIYYIDGVEVFRVTDPSFDPVARYPQGGYFTFGRRLTERRDSITAADEDVVLVDYIKVFQP